MWQTDEHTELPFRVFCILRWRNAVKNRDFAARVHYVENVWETAWQSEGGCSELGRDNTPIFRHCRKARSSVESGWILERGDWNKTFLRTWLLRFSIQSQTEEQQHRLVLEQNSESNDSAH